MEAQNNRVGNFTSSEIWKLFKEGRKTRTFGEKALTYIQEKRFEKELCRSINTNAFAHLTSWGNFMEIYVHNKKLGHEYSLRSKEVLRHPEIPNFAGSPDFITETKVSDCKAPYTLTSFCKLVKNCEAGKESFKENHDDYYYQLVANSILTNKNVIELIVYLPYYTEFNDIMAFNDEFDWEGNGYNPFEFKWITDAILRDNGQLPYLVEWGKFKNLNKFEFEVTESDKNEVIEKINKASELLAQ